MKTCNQTARGSILGSRRFPSRSLGSFCAQAEPQNGGVARSRGRLSDEHRRKISEARTRQWQDPAFRKKMSAAREGVAMPASWSNRREIQADHRRKISESRTRQWQDPAFRQKVAAGRTQAKGQPGWKAGCRKSEATRSLMSANALGRQHSAGTSIRMSQAASGRRHNHDTIEKISASMRGRTLSAEHRSAISLSQRRRYASLRVLAAVEQVHRDLSLQAEPTQSIALANIMSRRSVSASAEELQQEYSAQLREFRSLQAELRPWVDAFKQRYGQKPTLQDAQATDVDWIAKHFERYELFKSKLMAEIPIMRTSINAAAGSSTTRKRCARAAADIMNTNRPAITRVEASTRVQAALDYKQRRLASEEGEEQCSSAAKSVKTPELGKGKATIAVRAVIKGDRPVLPRAKAALLKAMQYKQNKAIAEAAAAADAPPAAPSSSRSSSAVKLVSVEGKTIGGIDYAGVDASTAAAGESSFIEAGKMPVQSRMQYRSQTLDNSSSSDAGRVAAPTTDALVSHAAASASRPSVPDTEFDVVVPELDAWSGSRQRKEADVHFGSSAAEDDDEDSDSEDGGGTSSGATTASDAVRQWETAIADPVVACSSDEGTRVGATVSLTEALLDLRSKQAAATAAMAHSAATAALHKNLLVCTAVESARAKAQKAVQEFEDARELTKRLLQSGYGAYGSGGLLMA